MIQDDSRIKEAIKFLTSEKKFEKDEMLQFERIFGKVHVVLHASLISLLFIKSVKKFNVKSMDENKQLLRNLNSHLGKWVLMSEIGTLQFDDDECLKQFKEFVHCKYLIYSTDYLKCGFVEFNGIEVLQVDSAYRIVSFISKGDHNQELLSKVDTGASMTGFDSKIGDVEGEEKASVASGQIITVIKRSCNWSSPGLNPRFIIYFEIKKNLIGMNLIDHWSVLIQNKRMLINDIN